MTAPRLAPSQEPGSALATTRSLLAELVAFPTVSADGNRALIDWASAQLAALGARLQRTEAPCGTRANLIATIGPAVDGGTVLSGHSDVVPVAGQVWSLPPFALTARDGRLYGRGTCDMKGFIACALALAPRFAAAPLTRPLHIALSHDEEVGCLGAPIMLAELVRTGPRPATCIVGEPTEMRVIEGHKGMCEYTTRFTGLAGHGSDPDAGVSAVEAAIRYGARLLALREELRARVPDGSSFSPPWSTLQIGRMAGGHSHNVIAEQAELDWELRPVCQADRDHTLDAIDGFAQRDLLPAMRAVHPQADIRRAVIGEVTGLDVIPRSEAVALACALTGEAGTGLVPFNTEAGIFQDHGIAAVVCGPGSIAQAHKADEFIEEAQLVQCLAMIERLVPRLCG
jgi:acetylornithine deacetylase